MKPEESKVLTMDTKRILLATGPLLLREALHRVLNKAEHLEVLQEVPDHEDLPAAVERFAPEWVIVPLPISHRAQAWIEARRLAFPTVGFIFISPDHAGVKIKQQASYENEYFDLSLEDFVQLLEKDLQHT
jgi:DNA-binding NarL/FixJ family response regulator